jgi:hypothetical protein
MSLANAAYRVVSECCSELESKGTEFYGGACDVMLITKKRSTLPLALFHRRPVVIAGGRAVDALRSITVAQHLFGIQKIVVVHHSHCGGTSFTANGIINAYRHEHHVDISHLYERSSICITDYEASLKHDTALVRSHDGTPKHVDIFGYFYDIDTGTLTEVVRDIHGIDRSQAKEANASSVLQTA